MAWLQAMMPMMVGGTGPLHTAGLVGTFGPKAAAAITAGELLGAGALSGGMSGGGMGAGAEGAGSGTVGPWASGDAAAGGPAYGEAPGAEMGAEQLNAPQTSLMQRMLSGNKDDNNNGMPQIRPLNIAGRVETPYTVQRRQIRRLF